VQQLLQVLLQLRCVTAATLHPGQQQARCYKLQAAPGTCPLLQQWVPQLQQHRQVLENTGDAAGLHCGCTQQHASLLEWLLGRRLLLLLPSGSCEACSALQQRGQRSCTHPCV
jgi:hypothetical protein